MKIEIKKYWHSLQGMWVTLAVLVGVFMGATIKMFLTTDADLSAPAWIWFFYMVVVNALLVRFWFRSTLAESYKSLIFVGLCLWGLFWIVSRTIYGLETELLVDGDCYTFRTGSYIHECHPSEKLAREAMEAAQKTGDKALTIQDLRESRDWQELPK